MKQAHGANHATKTIPNHLLERHSAPSDHAAHEAKKKQTKNKTKQNKTKQNKRGAKEGCGKHTRRNIHPRR
jgi:hypothetical protein